MTKTEVLSQMSQSPSVSASQGPRPAYLATLLAVTIFISAFLLFQVQPLISKFILPWFGGSPAVWTTAMLFFQCTLFLGYVYSHLLVSRLRLVRQVQLHIGLLAISSLMAIFVIPPESLKPIGNEDPTLRILLLLTLCVGLPYALLSTTGPLIQAWFALAYPGRSPYRLFSLSNLGSLIALGSFPFVFEPYMELKSMGRFWMIGFWVFAGLCTMCGLSLVRFVREPSGLDVLKSDTQDVVGMSGWWQRPAWVGLSALSSLMFIATTNHVCHDIATVPFLWIIPLGLYLLSFIVCFDHERWYVREVWCGLCIAGIVGLAIELDLGFVLNLALHFGTMLCICIVCHGELVQLRPTNRRNITEYYLLISAGGALGGLFISMIATRYFDDYYEWPVGLLASCTVAASMLAYAIVSKLGFGLSGRVLAGACVAVGVSWIGWSLDPFHWRSNGNSDGMRSTQLLQSRNFYGTVTVTDRQYTRLFPASENDNVTRDMDSGFRSFWSGNVLHGRQWSAPSKRALPLTYYDRDSGVGRAIDYCISETHRERSLKYAVVGLGSGALAAYARPCEGKREADECVLYEINPLVEEIARKHFWYLPEYEKRLGKQIEVRLGDARLSMEREAPQEYDIIVLDAFSGDSVPAHLLTREAFEIYRKHLKKDEDGSITGMICIHITNTYLNLYPVVKNAAEQVLGMQYTSIYKVSDRQELLMRSHYFVISNDPSFLDRTPMIAPFTMRDSDRDGQEERHEIDQDWAEIPLWTDHYSTIFNILWKG